MRKYMDVGISPTLPIKIFLWDLHLGQLCKPNLTSEPQNNDIVQRERQTSQARPKGCFEGLENYIASYVLQLPCHITKTKSVNGMRCC